MRNGEARANPAARVVELSASDLPAFCPNPAMPLWSSHPKVFLDVVNESEAICPYCSTRYRLKGSDQVENSRFDTYHLHQHRAAPIPPSVTESRSSAARLACRRQTPNLAADARGNTSLELMMRWLKRRS